MTTQPSPALPTDTPAAAPAVPGRRRPRTLALDLVDALGERIRDGRLAPGAKLPTEAVLMQDFAVSRTVVREAISRLQAAGLVETRHGIGTFAVGPGVEAAVFRIAPEQMATLQDVIAVLELRIGLETEAAGLAAQRRSDDDLRRLRLGLQAVSDAVEAGRDAVAPDFQFHLDIARATQNPHFVELMAALGARIIPRARLVPSGTEGVDAAEAAQAHAAAEARRSYLRRVNAEHENILDAIERGDAEAARAAMRTHLANSRERRRRAGISAAS